MRVWSPKTSEEKVSVKGPKFHEGGIVCLKLMGDNSRAITGGVDSTVIVSSIEDGRVFSKSIDVGGSISGIDYFDPWKAIFVITYEGKMITFDNNTMKVLHEETEKSGTISVIFNEKMKCFIVSTVDGQIVFHSYGKTGVVSRMKLHSSEIHQHRIHDNTILTAGEDRNIVMSELPHLI